MSKFLKTRTVAQYDYDAVDTDARVVLRVTVQVRAIARVMVRVEEWIIIALVASSLGVGSGIG